MRTIIELPEKQLKALKIICQKRHLPRAVVIRQAIDFYIEKQGIFQENDVFGLWHDRDIDSLTYEKLLRKEWDL